MSRVPFHRRLRLTLPLLALLALAGPGPAGAALDPVGRARLTTPRPVAPAPDQKLVEDAVRFVFETPRGTTDVRLVISDRPFDTFGWRAIPAREDLRVLEAGGRALTLADAGYDVDSDTPLWWAVAARDAATGELRVSEVRRVIAQRRFMNRVAPSPLVLAARRSSEPRAERLAAARDARFEAGAAARPRLRLTAGYDFDPAEGLPEVPTALARASAAREDDPRALRSWLVQFAAAPDPQDLALLQQAGAAVVSYIPDQAYLVRMSDEARARLAARDDGPAWIGEYLPAYKLSPAAATQPSGPASFVALLFPDGDPLATRRALQAMGATELRISDNGINRKLSFRLEPAALAAVAALGDVAWIEPAPRFELHNALAQWVVQTGAQNNRRVWNQGLQGQGQLVMTSDSGILTTHDQFRDPAVALTGFGEYPTHRKIVAYQRGGDAPEIEFGDHPGASWHGSHTAGTVAGSDDAVAGASSNDGIAKQARLWFMDVSGTALANGVAPFDDLNDLFLPSYLGNAAGRVRVSSNSWGSAVSGAYTLNSMEADQFAWAHPDYYIAFSNGNAGPTNGSTSSPASAKNVAGIGGTGNGTQSTSMYSFSSRGPTADGRRKPTFVAPAANVTSSIGAGNNSYGALSGTSMASPASTGGVLLMRQYLTEGWYPTGVAVPANAFEPSAALLRAMGINSASRGVTSTSIPDNVAGWGRINADSVLYFAGDARRLLLLDDTHGLMTGEIVEYEVNVTSAAQPFEIVLAWTDYPGNPAAARQLVNDLDLEVTNGVLTYKGSVMSNGRSSTGGSRDSLNVEEAVRLEPPTTGVWTVRVRARAVPIGPQPFALCMTGGIGYDAGAVALDRASYGPADTLEIEVVDVDATDPVTVTVASGTEPGGETVTLAGASGVWRGALPLSLLGAQGGDGGLSVSNGDGITATYFDASLAVSLDATAGVSFVTPMVTEVSAVATGGGNARVTWKTDVNATSRVYYGLTPALELGSVEGSGYRLAHDIMLSGLTPGATYYYDVESASVNGGAVRDDLGGAHHRVTARGQGDVLLVMSDGAFPNLTTWLTALDELGYEADLWTGTQAEDPAVGDATQGMRSYKAVLWQVGAFDYPAVSDVQRARIDSLLAGGGRLLITGHDIGWSLADLASPSYSAERAAWLANALKVQQSNDPSTFNFVVGATGDPISDGFGSLIYAPFGTGLAGDGVFIAPGTPGTTGYVWREELATTTLSDSIAIRWESPDPLGSPSGAFWGGQNSRLVGYFFEWTNVLPPATASNGTRNDVLDRAIQWLLGRERPLVTITSPNGGELVEGYNVPVTWDESVAPGRAVGDRTLELSLDSGASWAPIASGIGPSPYAWPALDVPNTAGARLRLRVSDDGTPPLSASDVSDADFTVARPFGDNVAPVVVAGSVRISPNPVVRPAPAVLTARISDAGTGGSPIAGAEWSLGAAPAGPGLGYPMEGAFGAVTVDVLDTLDTFPLATGARTVWVRGRDAAGLWSAAQALSFQLNGPEAPVSAEGAPALSFLAQNAPNPFGGRTTLRFGLASAGNTELVIFDTQGRHVRTLVSGSLAAGTHAVTWDGTDQSGGRVKPGVFYARLSLPGQTLQKRMVALE